MTETTVAMERGKAIRTKRPVVSDLSVLQRVELAKVKTAKLVDYLLHVIELHEANQIIVYSPALASQIPTSHAAHAFNTFQDSSLRFEIARLCALFDPCRPNDFDMESIPAVVQLINDMSVLDWFEENQRVAWHSVISSDETCDDKTREILNHHQERHSIELAARTRASLERVIIKTRDLEQSSKLKAVRNFRDKYIAHSLAISALEHKEMVRNMRFGEEKHLLWKALAFIDALHSGVNGSGFSWKSAIRMSRRNAAALWRGFSFKIQT